MTVNYKNSAGTDLDSLFSNTSSNAGSIGFLTSGGQDLGDRYYKGSLGYNVGYKNSAGTDIGYLRGKEPEYNATMTVGTSGSYLFGYFEHKDKYYGSLSPRTFSGKTIVELLENTASGKVFIVNYFYYTSPATVNIKNIENGKSISIYCGWETSDSNGSLGLRNYAGQTIRLMITIS